MRNDFQNPYVDRLGNELRPGDYIVHPRAISSSAYLGIAKILELTDGATNYRRNTAKLKVIGTTSWSWRGSVLNSRTSYIENIGNVLKISEDQIPEDLLKEFDKY